MSEKEINRIARKTGFVKIDGSPIDGCVFLKLLLQNSEQDTDLSLNQMGIEVKNKNGESLSKQAIDARFSEKSVLFIQTIFENYLQKINQTTLSETDLGWMNLFNRVLVKDGTRFDLPEAFARYFKGFGGKCASDAGMCIQFEFDLKTGKIVDLNLTAANIPDSKDAQLTKDSIQNGDLILRDLGYFGLNIFEEVVEKQAYFISKLNTQTLVYEHINDIDKVLDLKKIKTTMESMNQEITQLDVLVGKETKIALRLVVEKVPQHVYEQRIREKTAAFKKQGYQMSDGYATRQHFNLYITNIDKEKLPAQAIRNIYRLRWQVELIFKQWKSTYKIDKTHAMKYHRWMSLFYARMLLMLIHWQIYHLVKATKYKLENKLLSINKSLKSLKLASKEITALIQVGIANIKKTIEKLTQMLASKHDLEKKKGQKNQQEIMDIIYCKSED